MKKGLVIGKFYPPHNGHSYLIETALKHADKVDVLVCDSPAYRILAVERAKWIQELHPGATIHVIPDIGNDDDSKAWAKHTMEFLGYAPDVVFSSENYGDAYAKYMGATHYEVDKKRRTVPIAARKIRPDVLAHWQFLSPTVRQKFAIRVCVLGAESTGTTTLSKALAEHYGAPWVPEYGRTYTEALLDPDHVWHTQEFVHIARIQQQMENQLAGESNNGLLICDTNAFATRLWHERYVGEKSKAVDAIAAKDKVDLYIITDVDIPFVQDGIRDGEHIRHAMHEQFITEVEATGVPFIVVSGSVSDRLKTACQQINALLKTKVVI